MTSTYYRFPVARSRHELSLPDSLVYCFEKLLLLGSFYENGMVLKPSHVVIDEQPLQLFMQPDRHIWSENEGTTTKSLLAKARREKSKNEHETIDSEYDIDVLRMTEPRILFLHDFLAVCNTFESNARRTLFGGYAPNTEASVEDVEETDLTVVFEGILDAFLSQLTLFDNSRERCPEEFRFSTEIPFHPLKVGKKAKTGQSFFQNTLKWLQKIVNIEIRDDFISHFSLKDYRHWLQSSDGQPFEVLGVLSRDCNAKCDFCYVLGNPGNSAIKLQKHTNKLSGLEAKTRLDFFEKGLMLPIPTYDTEEITTHPYFLEACERIRKHSDVCISITTNGYKLTEGFLQKLASFAPVDISLSLNSARPDTRTNLMRGAHQRGLEALGLLNKFKLPFAVTMVAWPRVPISDLIETIRFVDEYNVRSISVLLGGYTKLFPKAPEYPIPSFWNKVIDEIAPLRTELRNPFIIQPRMYEEVYRFSSRIGRNIVTGVNQFSPAARAGIKVYDEIIAINGMRMTTRNQCLATIAGLCQTKGKTIFTLSRAGEELDVSVDPSDRGIEYIFPRSMNDRYGIHLIGEDIPVKAIRQIYDLINEYEPNKVLFLTSMIVRQFLAKALKRYHFLAGHSVEFDLQVPSNKYLGGNIVMGDMLVVDDFVHFIQEYMQDQKPDLIMIPSGPFNHGGWCRDMKGQPVGLIEKFFDVPIKIIEAPYFE